jgi:signal transduction histidine kinase
MLNIGGSCLVTVMELIFILSISNSIQRQLIEKSNSINAMNKELNATIHTRDKMISIISHDVRGPLSLINSGLNLVDWEANLDKEEKDIVQELQKRADATVNLIDNLVLWSRSQTKEIHYSPKLLSNNDLNDILSNILTLQNSKGIRIDWQLNEGGEVFTDKNLLQAILRNLLSNAVKFTSIGGSITVKTKTLDKGIEISITDSGMGMSEETIHKIESGISLTSLGTENEKGHGIGLQLVSEFLEKSGSKLHIKSTLGKGSTFSFILGSKA